MLKILRALTAEVVLKGDQGEGAVEGGVAEWEGLGAGVDSALAVASLTVTVRDSVFCISGQT